VNIVTDPRCICGLPVEDSIHFFLECSADLFRVNIVTDPRCMCGLPVEDSIHFFLECSLVADPQNLSINTLHDNVQDKITLILPIVGSPILMTLRIHFFNQIFI
jgi:hypothetical protein